jgi:hypothetical protein
LAGGVVGCTSIASPHVGVEREQLPEDTVGDVEEPEAEAPPRLRAAGEDILRRGQDVRSSSLESDIGDRLLRVLHQVGLIDHVCHEHAGGLFAEDREPQDEWEREDLEQSTRGFICWCADQLAEAAGLAVEFATVLCAEVEDHKSRSEIVDELRSELMMELAIETAPPTRHAPLSATKRAVADDVEIDLRFAAGDLAKAAFELADSRWPAQAAVTAVYVAAKLLAAGGRIAETVGYESSPERER